MVQYAYRLHNKRNKNMFKKLIASLPYNPSTIDQIAFYSKRLKRENSLRKLGLLFVILSMLVQIVAVSFPAEKSLAASSNDVIYGGVSSVSDLKRKYDSHADVRALYNRFGINGNDITNASVEKVSFGFKSQGAKGTRTVGRINFASTKDQNLGSFAGTTFYSRSAAEWSGSTTAYYFGKQKGTDGNYYQVWVLKDCGNIGYRKVDAPPEKPKPKPKPEPAPKVVTKPVVSCSRLTASKTSGTKFVNVRFTGSYSANKANLVNGYTFDFGDGTVTKSAGPVIDHNYTNTTLQPKTYTAKLTINSTLGDKTATTCATTITVLPEVCSLNKNLAPNDPRCAVCPYNSSFNIDDPRCKPTPVCANDPTLKPEDPKCKCIDNPDITANDPNCTTPGKLKKVQNITQNLSPEQTLTSTAKAGDVLEYSLVTTNTNIVSKTGVIVDDYVGDILDYANLDEAFLQKQGGTFVAATKTVRWENQAIPANDQLVKSFRVIMKNPIPSTNTPNATATDFDCKLQNGYGNELSINVECPVLKTVEQLPNTGPGTTLAVAFTITVISSYFFARSWLMAKELGIIRREYQKGT